eukprot:1381351-Amorphochlora_amoeboformis.AAC.1
MEVECEGSPSSPILFEKIRLFGAGSRGKSKNRGTKKRKCDPLKKLSEKKSRRAGSRSKAGDDHCFTSSSSVEREVRTCLEILGDTTLHDPKMKSIQGSCKKDIPFAPTLTPSEEEFKDFYTYLSKISTEATRYGVCKIIPPASWNPNFMVPEGSFSCTEQKISSIALNGRAVQIDNERHKVSAPTHYHITE